MKMAEVTNSACVHGSTNGTNGIPISFKVLPMVPLVLPLVPMVMTMVPLALPMVPLVKLPMVPLGEPRTGPVIYQTVYRRKIHFFNQVNLVYQLTKFQVLSFNTLIAKVLTGYLHVFGFLLNLK